MTKTKSGAKGPAERTVHKKPDRRPLKETDPQIGAAFRRLQESRRPGADEAEREKIRQSKAELRKQARGGT